MKFVIILCICLSLFVPADACLSQIKTFVESRFVTKMFTNYCGSSTSQPTCTCLDGSTWVHPYYIKECADGSSPLSCVCPDGTDFPATVQQILTG